MPPSCYLFLQVNERKHVDENRCVFYTNGRGLQNREPVALITRKHVVGDKRGKRVKRVKNMEARGGRKYNEF